MRSQGKTIHRSLGSWPLKSFFVTSNPSGFNVSASSQTPDTPGLRRLLRTPFQIIDCFNISRYILFVIYILYNFIMYLDIHYTYVHRKNYIFRKTKKIYNLQRRKYLRKACLLLLLDGLKVGMQIR